MLARERRRGFTVVEVLVALAVLVVGTAGVTGLVATSMARSGKPGLAEEAAFFAAERLNYFRSQVDLADTDGGLVNGFVAAGGSYFPPPSVPGQPDLSADETCNNYQDDAGTLMNRVPVLFVREYLYESTESKDHDLTQLLGQRNQRRRFIEGQTFARNEIPPTPMYLPGNKRVGLVRPNDESKPTPGAAMGLASGTVAIPMPRANDDLRGVGANLSDRTLRFVREVWVQLNNPMLGDTGTLSPGAPAFEIAPPYTAVVTVRVYLKEPRITAYDKITAGNAGVGYFSNKPPLAEMVGCLAMP